MITNISKNCMGTVSFDGKFGSMRKAQEFVVYPMKSDDCKNPVIQSDTRIGRIDLSNGEVSMSPPRQGGAYSVHLAFAKSAGKLDAETIFMLKAAIFSTASGKAGNNVMGVYTDNIGAIEVFQ